MNTAKNLYYNDYDVLAESLKNSSEEEVIKRYKVQNSQAPHLRVISAILIVLLFSVLVIPSAFLIFRYAQIHEEQNNLYKINLAIEDYKTKTNEIKERLESNTSLDDLELYAVEQLSMIKANSDRVIILEDMGNTIKKPSISFSIANVSEESDKW